MAPALVRNAVSSMKSLEREEAVDRSGFAVVFQDVPQAHHRRSPIRVSTGSCFAASYRARLCPDRKRHWSI